MTETPESKQASAGRGEDDRRNEVNPADNPAPRSPAADQEAIRKGEENLHSVTNK